MFAPTIAVLAVGIGLVFTVIMGYFKYVRNPDDTHKSGNDKHPQSDSG